MAAQRRARDPPQHRAPPVALVVDVGAVGLDGAHRVQPHSRVPDEAGEHGAGLAAQRAAQRHLGAQLGRHAGDPEALPGGVKMQVTVFDRDAEHRRGREDDEPCRAVVAHRSSLARGAQPRELAAQQPVLVAQRLTAGAQGAQRLGQVTQGDLVAAAAPTQPRDLGAEAVDLVLGGRTGEWGNRHREPPGWDRDRRDPRLSTRASHPQGARCAAAESTDAPRPLSGCVPRARPPGSGHGPGAEPEPARLDPTERVELLLGDLHGTPAGLSSREAARRLVHAGPNVLVRRGGRRWPRELARQFVHPLALLLWGAAVLAWAAGIVPVAIAIVARDLPQRGLRLRPGDAGRARGRGARRASCRRTPRCCATAVRRSSTRPSSCPATCW